MDCDGPARERAWTFRERVRGEMIGDLELIRSTVAPTFTYIAHTGDGRRRTVAPGTADSDLFTPLCAAEDLVIWLTVDQFVADKQGVAADGLLHISCPPEAAPRYGVHASDPDAFHVITSEIALFVRFADRLMSHEVTYSDPATQTVSTVPPADTLRRRSLRERIDRELPRR